MKENRNKAWQNFTNKKQNRTAEIKSIILLISSNVTVNS